MITAGLDLSLASTGLCVLDTETGEASVRTIRTKANGVTPTHYLERFDVIAAELIDATMDADLIAVEGRGFMVKAGAEAQHQLSGLWWHVWRLTRPDLEVNPTTIKKYATGTGNASKDVVLANAVRRYPAAAIMGNDEADAAVLAYLLARLAGHPAEAHDPPKSHLEALRKLALPDQL